LVYMLTDLGTHFPGRIDTKIICLFDASDTSSSVFDTWKSLSNCLLD
jgi:hypothetical protein